MFTGVQKIAVYDPATGLTVQLNKIAPDADIKIKSPIEIKDVSSNLYYDGDESFIEFASFDIEYFYQLESWMTAHTPIRLIAWGVDYNLFWEESVNLTVRKTYGSQPGNRNMMIVRLSKERGTHSIYAVSNILRKLGRFVDGNADEKADNLVFSATGTYNFVDASLYQEITGVAPGSYATTNRMVFPFPGVTLFAKMNKVSIGGPAQSWTFTLSAWDSANNFLSSSTVTDSDDVLSLALPALTYSVRLQIDVATGAIVKFYLPYLGRQRSSYLNIIY